MSYQTIRVRFENDLCFLQFNRPQANNAINDLLIEESRSVIKECESSAKVVVLEGLPEVFCFGADFQALADHEAYSEKHDTGPEPLYDLWLQLARGPFITIAHVRGKTNAGGIGFVAACDLVLSDTKAEFSLSELLFGLIPACVLPFLIRRIGFQKAHYMTLMTKPFGVEVAEKWGLVDAFEENSNALVRKHLLRLKRLSKKGIQRYKNYANILNSYPEQLKEQAIRMNEEVFSDRQVQAKINRYVQTGVFPWED